jgi:WD40 repeat protein
MRPRLEGITPLGLSPDGRLLAMGDVSGRVAVYDVRTRRPIPGDFRAAKWVNDLDFSPDGSLLAVATGSGLVQLWDVQTATRRHQLRTAPYAEGVEFSADGRTLVTMSADEGISLSGLGDTYLTRWDVGDGSRLEGPVKVTSRGGEILLTTPDRARLVVVARDEILVAAAGTLRPVRRFLSRRGQPEQLSAAVRPTDGRTLALGLQDGAVELLDLSTGRRRRLGRQEGSVHALAFSADGATLVTGDVARRVRLWDVASGQVRETFEGHEGTVVGFCFSPDGRTLYSAGSSSVIAWDLEGSGRLGRPFTFAPAPPLGGADNPLSFAISPDGSNLATPDGKALDKIALRDLRAPKQIRRRLSPGVGGIVAMAFQPDGRHLAVGGERADSAPVLVDVTSGRVTRRMTVGHDGGFATLAFDPEGKRLLAGGHDRRAIVWDVETGKQLLDLRHPGDDPINVTAAAWSPDGTLVATAGGSGLVAVWRAADRKQVATFKGDTEWVLSVAFSPDGSMIAAGALADKQATLWEVATGKRVGRLPHPTVVSQATFDPSGRTLATAGSDGTLRLWDVASRRQIGLAFPGPPHWSTPTFDPAGDHLVALYSDGSAMVWNVDPDHWKQRACTVASRTLTREEWQELLPYRRYQPACR